MQSVPPGHHKSARYVPLRTTPHASVHISTEEIFLLASMCAFAAFNLHDAENTNFFNILTVVPGAVFSFKCLVMNGDRSLVVLSIVTAYWLFFSIAIFNGYMYKNEESYLSIRLMLLGALGAKAYQKVWYTKDNEVNDAASPTPRSEYFFAACSELSLQSRTTTAGPRRETASFVKKAMQPNTAKHFDSLLHASTPAQTRDSLFEFYKEENNAVVSEADRISTSRMKSSTQLSTTSAYDSERSSSRTQSSSSYTPSTSSTISTHTSTMPERTGLLRTGIPARSEHVETCDRLRTAAMKSLTTRTAAMKTQMTVNRTQMTTEKQKTAIQPEQNREKVVVSYGDIITNPLAMMKFSEKENTRKLIMTNITSRTIMWALKASTVHSFNAIPAHGVLHPGRQQGIIICLVAQLPLKDSEFSSKIAIDYAFVNATEKCFDRSLFKSMAKKRHVLQAVLSA